MKKQFRQFKEAKKFVQKLNLKSYTEWTKYSRSDQRPIDIPRTPNHVYKNEWKSWGDFLGTGNVAPFLKKYRSFEDARKFTRSLNLKYNRNWIDYCKSGKRPDDIPFKPERTYKNEWKSWGDWLGTGNIAFQKRKYRTFQDAKQFVQKLKVSSQNDWNKNYLKSGKRPDDIPARPSHVYKNEWKGWGDWLGTGEVAVFLREFWSFEKARKYVHTLKIKNSIEWRDFCKTGKLPNYIPKNPPRTYKHQWISMGDWLGTGSIHGSKIIFWSFEKAQKYVHSLNLKSLREWKTFCKSGKLPKDIPNTPDRTYNDKGWKNWGDWLGTGSISPTEKSKRWISWKQAKPLYRKIKIENNLKKTKDWEKYVKTHKLPKGLPPDPYRIYTKERVGKMMK